MEGWFLKFVGYPKVYKNKYFCFFMVKLFSTQFVLNNDSSLDDFLELGKNWVSGGPYPGFKYEQVRDLDNHGDVVEGGGFLFSVAKVSSDDYDAIGVNYQNPGRNNDYWGSEVVGVKYGDNFLVSVSVDYESSMANTNIPISKKPHIIKMMLEEIGGGMDGDIKVSDCPVYLNDGDEAFVSDILRGVSDSVMPITYVSVDDSNMCGINPGQLSKFLSGVSHVFVEPSRSFSFEMKNHMRGKNVFGGGVGVYWSGGTGNYLWVPKDIERLGLNPEREISKKIIEALTSRRIPRKLTLDNLYSLHNLSEIREIMEGHKDDMDNRDQILALYDKELELKTAQLEKAESQISKLEFMMRSTSSCGEGLLLDPQIVQIYDGEVRTVLLDTLEESRNHLSRVTRRKQILDKMLETTDMPVGRKRKVDTIKSTFKCYSGLTPSTKRELQKMGFEIDDGKKHYSLRLANEKGGISVTFPKTPSDIRSGKNIASEVIKTFF